MSFAGRRLLIVGVASLGHVGRHLADAAEALDIEYQLVDSEEALLRSPVARAMRILKKRKHLEQAPSFAAHLLARAREFRPHWCVVTGCVRVHASDLAVLSALGVRLLHYSTDDPWNPLFSEPWLFQALARYDVIFTPRQVNAGQFRQLAGAQVRHLAFAYNPELHRAASPQEVTKLPFSADVVFIGGADPQRVPFIRALVDAGLDVVVFGGYWRRHRVAGARIGGILLPSELRVVLAQTKLSVCLVRRQNRDSHVMRTYEEPAMLSCMLFEDTTDHRELFGPCATQLASFSSPVELAARATRLLAEPASRQELRSLLHDKVTKAPNTYVDRLITMLSTAESEPS